MPESQTQHYSSFSSGKQPLSQKELHSLFSSSDNADEVLRDGNQQGADLSLLYASMESIGSIGSMGLWKSNDISLFTSIDSNQMPPLKASGSGQNLYASLDAALLFASIEPLPLKSLDVKPASPDSKASKWTDAYLSALQPPAAPPTSKAKEAKKAPKNKTTGNATSKPNSRDKIYVGPLSMDIISGRGGKSNLWHGNMRYREVIEEAKPAYREGAKFEKTMKSQEVVDILLNEGRRFLKLETNGPRKGEYYLMTKNQARKKAGQALREENTPESRRQKREKYAKRN